MTDSEPSLPKVPPGLRERYRVLRELGRGGMGVVLEVEDLELGRTVALKLSSQLTHDLARARFLREAQVAARIRHPHVIEIYDSGIADGVPYLTMELLESRALDDLPCPEDPEAVFLKVADALECIHAQGLVHRDVKPGNILCSDERVLLADFGLVHDPDQTALTRTGMMPGTMAFMAPEMMRGEPIAPAVDWWALGVALFEVVERRMPYDVQAVMAFASGNVRPPPRFRKVPDDSRVARMARAWMAEAPGDRPSTVAELQRVLEEPLSGSASGAVHKAQVRAVLERADSDEAPRPSYRRGVGGALAVLLLGGVGAGTLLRSPASPASPVPTPRAEEPPSDPYPRITEASEFLDRPASIQLLQTPDPWVWGYELSRTPSLLALLPLVTDPQAHEGLARIDAELRARGRPALFHPHLVEIPDVSPLIPPELPDEDPFRSLRELWPKRPGPRLSHALEVAQRTLDVYAFLHADIRAAEMDRPTSEVFPFPRFRTGIFAINGWDLALGMLETRVDVRERAHEWFRPCVDGYREMMAALGASLRAEPDTRAAAALLGIQMTDLIGRAFYSWLSVLEPRWLTGGAPATAEGWALRAAVLRRQVWVIHRGSREATEAASGSVQAAREALEDLATDRAGAWIRGDALGKLAWVASEGFPVPDLTDRVTRHLPAILRHASPHIGGSVLIHQLDAAREEPSLRPLTAEMAQLGLEYLLEHPEALVQYEKRKPGRTARLVGELAGIAATPDLGDGG